MVSFKQRGDYSRVTRYLNRIKTQRFNLDQYAREGVEALAAATPKDSGATAGAWYYTIENQNGRSEIRFKNSNINDGVSIAIILQYGHGTGTGGWVEGVDYINPALKPLFEEIANKAWMEVTKV